MPLDSGHLAPYFVMAAGRANQDDSHVYVFGEGATLKDAHRSAEAHYRRERGVASSVQVQTVKLAEVATMQEAEALVKGIEEMERG